MSVAVVTGRPSICSGLAYSGVIAPNSVGSCGSASASLEMPKSISLGVPSSVTMILPGFMSRWITRLRWANATPSQARLKSFRRSRKLKFREKQYSSIGSPATNSIAMYGMPSSVVPVSKILAIFGCSRLDWISISR